MIKAFRTITVGAVAAVAALGIGVAVHASSADGATPACAASNMEPSERGKEAISGYTYQYWRLTNKGGSTCVLTGFPYFTNYREDGRPLYSVSKHSGGSPTVTLRAGEHARVTFLFKTPTASCPPEHPGGMALSWPGTNHPVIAPIGMQACLGTATAHGFQHG